METPEPTPLPMQKTDEIKADILSPQSENPEKGQMSPLTGAYLLIIISEPHSAEDRDKIIRRLCKGLNNWDVGSSHVDLNCELLNLTNSPPEGDVAKNGEKLIQWASENLVVEVLYHAQVNTLIQCVKNLLSSFTRYRHIIHAGYSYQGSGSWLLQDGTFSVADFTELWDEPEVYRLLPAYKSDITVSLQCAQDNGWSDARFRKEPFTKLCQLSVNGPEKLSSIHNAGIGAFADYLSSLITPSPLKEILQPSEIVGNIRFSHPTLYVFPGGQGDAALFGVNGFNMLIDGGYSRKACFWDFTRHLDRLDAVLLTRVNNNDMGGISALLERKNASQVFPQIGHFFGNILEKKGGAEGEESKGGGDDLILSLTDLGYEMYENLRGINMKPHFCTRENLIEPINLYHKVGHGKLDMYILNPVKDSKELKEFMSKWKSENGKHFASTSMPLRSSGPGGQDKECPFPVLNLVSICALIVWQPASPTSPITRILFPGSTPQQKIFESLTKLKHLDFLRYPTCTGKSLALAAHKSTVKSEKIITEVKHQVKSKEGSYSYTTIESKVYKSVPKETKTGQNKKQQLLGSGTETNSTTSVTTVGDGTGESTPVIKKEPRKTEKTKTVSKVISTTTTSTLDNKIRESRLSKFLSTGKAPTGPPSTTVGKVHVKPAVSSVPPPIRKVEPKEKVEARDKSEPVKEPSPTNSKKDLNGSEKPVKYGIGKVLPKTAAEKPVTSSPKQSKEDSNRKVIEHKTTRVASAKPEIGDLKVKAPAAMQGAKEVKAPTRIPPKVAEKPKPASAPAKPPPKKPNEERPVTKIRPGTAKPPPKSASPQPIKNGNSGKVIGAGILAGAAALTTGLILAKKPKLDEMEEKGAEERNGSMKSPPGEEGSTAELTIDKDESQQIPIEGSEDVKMNEEADIESSGSMSLEPELIVNEELERPSTVSSSIDSKDPMETPSPTYTPTTDGEGETPKARPQVGSGHIQGEDDEEEDEYLVIEKSLGDESLEPEEERRYENGRGSSALDIVEGEEPQFMSLPAFPASRDDDDEDEEPIIKIEDIKMEKVDSQMPPGDKTVKVETEMTRQRVDTIEKTATSALGDESQLNPLEKSGEFQFEKKGTRIDLADEDLEDSLEVEDKEMESGVQPDPESLEYDNDAGSSPLPVNQSNIYEIQPISQPTPPPTAKTPEASETMGKVSKEDDEIKRQTDGDSTSSQPEIEKHSKLKREDEDKKSREDSPKHAIGIKADSPEIETREKDQKAPQLNGKSTHDEFKTNEHKLNKVETKEDKLDQDPENVNGIPKEKPAPLPPHDEFQAGDLKMEEHEEFPQTPSSSFSSLLPEPEVVRSGSDISASSGSIILHHSSRDDMMEADFDAPMSASGLSQDKRDMPSLELMENEAFPELEMVGKPKSPVEELLKEEKVSRNEVFASPPKMENVPPHLHGKEGWKCGVVDVVDSAAVLHRLEEEIVEQQEISVLNAQPKGKEPEPEESDDEERKKLGVIEKPVLRRKVSLTYDDSGIHAERETTPVEMCTKYEVEEDIIQETPIRLVEKSNKDKPEDPKTGEAPTPFPSDKMAPESHPISSKLEKVEDLPHLEIKMVGHGDLSGISTDEVKDKFSPPVSPKEESKTEQQMKLSPEPEIQTHSTIPDVSKTEKVENESFPTGTLLKFEQESVTMEESHTTILSIQKKESLKSFGDEKEVKIDSPQKDEEKIVFQTQKDLMEIKVEKIGTAPEEDYVKAPKSEGIIMEGDKTGVKGGESSVEENEPGFPSTLTSDSLKPSPAKQTEESSPADEQQQIKEDHLQSTSPPENTEKADKVSPLGGDMVQILSAIRSDEPTPVVVARTPDEVAELPTFYAVKSDRRISQEGEESTDDEHGIENIGIPYPTSASISPGDSNTLQDVQELTQQPQEIKAREQEKGGESLEKKEVKGETNEIGVEPKTEIESEKVMPSPNICTGEPQLPLMPGGKSGSVEIPSSKDQEITPATSQEDKIQSITTAVQKEPEPLKQEEKHVPTDIKIPTASSHELMMKHLDKEDVDDLLNVIEEENENSPLQVKTPTRMSVVITPSTPPVTGESDGNQFIIQEKETLEKSMESEDKKNQDEVKAPDSPTDKSHPKSKETEEVFPEKILPDEPPIPNLQSTTNQKSSTIMETNRHSTTLSGLSYSPLGTDEVETDIKLISSDESSVSSSAMTVISQIIEKAEEEVKIYDVEGRGDEPSTHRDKKTKFYVGDSDERHPSEDKSDEEEDAGLEGLEIDIGGKDKEEEEEEEEVEFSGSAVRTGLLTAAATISATIMRQQPEVQNIPFSSSHSSRDTSPVRETATKELAPAKADAGAVSGTNVEEVGFDESCSPDMPSSVTASGHADSITVTWVPPMNSNVFIRGYTVGWGHGVPDEHQKLVDGHERSFIIEKLLPNADYVVSLRAFNQSGESEPSYQNAATGSGGMATGHDRQDGGAKFDSPMGSPVFKSELSRTVTSVNAKATPEPQISERRTSPRSSVSSEFDERLQFPGELSPAHEQSVKVDVSEGLEATAPPLKEQVASVLTKTAGSTELQSKEIQPISETQTVMEPMFEKTTITHEAKNEVSGLASATTFENVQQIMMSTMEEIGDGKYGSKESPKMTRQDTRERQESESSIDEPVFEKMHMVPEKKDSFAVPIKSEEKRHPKPSDEITPKADDPKMSDAKKPAETETHPPPADFAKKPAEAETHPPPVDFAKKPAEAETHPPPADFAKKPAEAETPPPPVDLKSAMSSTFSKISETHKMVVGFGGADKSEEEEILEGHALPPASVTPPPSASLVEAAQKTITEIIATAIDNTDRIYEPLETHFSSSSTTTSEIETKEKSFHEERKTTSFTHETSSLEKALKEKETKIVGGLEGSPFQTFLLEEHDPRRENLAAEFSSSIVVSSQVDTPDSKQSPIGFKFTADQSGHSDPLHSFPQELTKSGDKLLGSEESSLRGERVRTVSSSSVESQSSSQSQSSQKGHGQEGKANQQKEDEADTGFDESRSPDLPHSFMASGHHDTISVTWDPPINSNIFIRGYTVGWGQEGPDEHQKLVDGHDRSFTIEKLLPNSEYVVSLRSFNQSGEGVPVVLNVATREGAIGTDHHGDKSESSLTKSAGMIFDESQLGSSKKGSIATSRRFSSLDAGPEISQHAHSGQRRGSDSVGFHMEPHRETVEGIVESIKNEGYAVTSQQSRKLVEIDGKEKELQSGWSFSERMDAGNSSNPFSADPVAYETFIIGGDHRQERELIGSASGGAQFGIPGAQHPFQLGQFQGDVERFSGEFTDSQPQSLAYFHQSEEKTGGDIQNLPLSGKFPFPAFPTDPTTKFESEWKVTTTTTTTTKVGDGAPETKSSTVVTSGGTGPGHDLPTAFPSNLPPTAGFSTTPTAPASGNKEEEEDILKKWGKPLGLPGIHPEDVALEPSSGGHEGRVTPRKEGMSSARTPSTPKSGSTSGKTTKRAPSSGRTKNLKPIYVDLAYVPHHGNSNYSDSEFFRLIRSRYYVFSGLEPSREVFDGLLQGKQEWEDKNLDVTIVPTYDTDTLGYWVVDSEVALAESHIDLAPSASRCTINLQDHETSCSAYRLEF